MGLLDKVSDSVLKKVAKKETIRIPYEQLVEIVKDEFIKGSDDDFLKRVRKTAKGGGMITQKELKSTSERYVLHVGSWNYIWLFGRRKQSYVFDNVKNTFYQLNKDGHWKKFYKAVDAAIQMEKINRNR